MKYINEIEKTSHQIKQKETNFNKNGLVANVKDKVYAKSVDNETEQFYYIKTYQNQPFDPMGANATRENYLETKMKRVSKDTFDFYLIYLQTNNSIYLTRTNRRFINE
jgi:hypothetical protein